MEKQTTAITNSNQQTLDLKDKAYHVGFANTRSIGIEIANVGAYSPPLDTAPFNDWYDNKKYLLPSTVEMTFDTSLLGMWSRATKSLSSFQTTLGSSILIALSLLLDQK